MRYDCIVGYHLNYLTCGIAKFNVLLAAKLGLPVRNLYDATIGDCKSLLLSVKLSEFTQEDLAALPNWIARWSGSVGYSVFLHGYDGMPLEDELIRGADRVYCGNRALHERLRRLRSEIITLWCPGTNMSKQKFETTELSVFSFGMAHKLKTEKYYRLKQLLEQTGKTYSIVLSTALHEGTSFDDSFIEVFNEMRGIFGERVYFMGYLSDQAVYNQLLKSDFFAAFFDGGLRSNNTSVNSALEAGAVVITNLDSESPEQLIHATNILDINQLESLPRDHNTLEDIRARAGAVGRGSLGWDQLIAQLTRK